MRRRSDVPCSLAAAHDSIGAFDPKSRTIFLRNSLTAGVGDIALKKDIGGVPLFGDWRGTGISTLAMFDPARSEFAIFASNLAPAPDRTIVLALPGHDPGDIPLSGDWDGDRVQTIGVYRASTSTFYLRNRNTSGPPDHVIRFGQPGDLPVVGDWNGSGRTGIGVFQAAGATFLLRDGARPRQIRDADRLRDRRGSAGRRRLEWRRKRHDRSLSSERRDVLPAQPQRDRRGRRRGFIRQSRVPAPGSRPGCRRRS